MRVPVVTFHDGPKAAYPNSDGKAFTSGRVLTTHTVADGEPVLTRRTFRGRHIHRRYADDNTPIVCFTEITHCVFHAQNPGMRKISCWYPVELS
jgi:hypothetical protein